MYCKSHTQGDCSRINAKIGSQIYAPVQALDHESNSLPLGYRGWHSEIQILSQNLISLNSYLVNLSDDRIESIRKLDPFFHSRRVEVSTSKWD